MYYIGHMSGFGLLGMLLFWGLFIWLIIWLINQNTRESKSQQSPIQIIKERYAKGELTKKEYEGMRRELEKGDESKSSS